MANSKTTDSLVMIASIAGLIIGVSIVVYAILHPVSRVSCTDFNSYNDALRAYTAGAVWLDGDGDGRPCEKLDRRDNPTMYGA